MLSTLRPEFAPSPPEKKHAFTFQTKHNLIQKCTLGRTLDLLTMQAKPELVAINARCHACGAPARNTIWCTCSDPRFYAAPPPPLVLLQQF
jgi:hypothetical protein